MTGELVVQATGEVVQPMTRDEARSMTARIEHWLRKTADDLAQVMPLIRDALTRRAWEPLGFSGVSEYVSASFGGQLSRLPAEVRSQVVRELSDAGMSTRAIAPVVGAGTTTVRRDLAGAPHGAPAPVTGLDGKRYDRRSPAPAPEPSLTRQHNDELRAEYREHRKAGQPERDRVKAAHTAYAGITSDLVTGLIQSAEAIADYDHDGLTEVLSRLGYDSRAHVTERLTLLRDACDRALTALGQPTQQHGLRRIK